MLKYKCAIRTISPYLQARFGEDAQASLKVKAGTKSKIDDDESWKKLTYADDKGFYVPTMQIRESLVNGGKAIKRKPYGNFKNIVQSYFRIEEEKIYLNKKEQDYLNTSYPKRADGQRVTLIHPAFNPGLELIFTLIVSSADIDIKTIKLIFEKAGLECGIGAWRAGGFGRYELAKFEEV